jgi:uncharacterized protein YbjT (DUF2867 family)
MTILITGGTGTLGRAVTDALASHPIRVLSRRAGDDHVVADLVTGRGLEEAVAGADTIIHLASTRRGATDVTATEHLVAAAPRVRHLVFVSIVGVDRVPIGYYRGKLAAERVVAKVPNTILRATQFHDLVQTLLAGAAKLPLMPVPTIRIQPVDVRDVAARLVELALGDPRGRVDDFGGPEVRDLHDLAREYLAETGRRRVIVPVTLPGKVFRAYREGGHLAPAHAAGTIPFANRRS